MNDKIKLTYIFLLKYNLNPDNWYDWQDEDYSSTGVSPETLVQAQMTCQYRCWLDAIDVIDFMAQFKPRWWSLFRCKMKLS